MNAIACGVIDTSMNDQLTPEERKSPWKMKFLPDVTELLRKLPKMVWNIVHAPEYMTGQIIGVDGGFL